MHTTSISDLEPRQQRLMVAVGPAPTSEVVLRWAKAQSLRLGCPWLAVHVQTSLRRPDHEQTGLDRNLALARELGAEVITTADKDVARGLLRVAAQQRITQLIVAKPLGEPLWTTFRSRSLLRRLLRRSGGVVVQIVPVLPHQQVRAASSWTRREWTSSTWGQYLTALVVIAGVTVGALFVAPTIGHRAVGFLYLFAVVVMASFVGRGPTFLAAVSSALLWDLFFEPPVFSLRISGLEDQFQFGLYFVVALVLGQLTARIRAQETAERQLAERATALYLLNQELAATNDLDQIFPLAIQQLERTFPAEVAVFLPDAADPSGLRRFPTGQLSVSPEELKQAGKAFAALQTPTIEAVGQVAGDIRYLPLRGSHTLLGVVGLRGLPPEPIPLHQRNLLDGFVQQIALAMERLRMRELLEATKVLAASERLSTTLLNSVSHEIRTPLAVIEVASSNLVDFAQSALPDRERGLIGDIREATERLNRLVGNVLDITRLEAGHVQPRLEFHDVGEVIRAAVTESGQTLARHEVRVQLAPNLPFVKLDPTLLHQAIINLLSNAAFHTPNGTRVDVTAAADDSHVVIRVTDYGSGVDPACLPRLFEKFYRTPNAATGGTGLGLSIVKGFVEAQHGQVQVANRPGGGLEFTIRLPAAHSLPDLND